MSVPDIKIVLPPINGDFLAGIAIGTEQALAASERLVVYRTYTDEKGALKFLDNEAVVKLTLMHLINDLNAVVDRSIGNRLLISGAAMALLTGNVCTKVIEGSNDAEEADGDWMEAKLEEFKKSINTDEAAKLANECMEAGNIQRAATVIVGTKINWLKEGHHVGTGQHDSGGFIKKVLKSQFPETDPNMLLSFAHRLGHWASTRSVLHQLGLGGIIAPIPIFDAAARLVPTDDVKLRLHSAPAGTARLAVSYALATRMFKHPLCIMCPDYENYNALPAAYKKVIKSPAAYHTGAKYLTGKKSDHNDTEYGAYIGRAGAWASVFMPRNTIMNSPHAKAYENADDYDADFKALCATFRADRTKHLRERMSKFKSVGMQVSGNYAQLCKAFEIDANSEAMAVLQQVALDRQKEEEAKATQASLPADRDADLST